ncbi:MAG: T9SS type A sorting domain-containing protein [Flavobacteriaceae bacterium]|nr:T9SS type A sorting domain-containing protein [Flavobacteriaceae bacterium]
MKKTLLFAFTLTFSFITFCQTTNEGEPLSWDLLETKTEITPVKLEIVDIQKIRIEDENNDRTPGKPWRSGILREIDYGLTKGGYWTELDNGDRIWRIVFESPDALNMSFNFSKFYLPNGANLYLYSDDRSDLLGAYTSQVNNESKMLGTWFVQSDKVWIEYFEPQEVRGKGELSISSLVHGYRLGHEFQKGYYSNAQLKALNDSGDCNHDVDCPIGNDFEARKDVLKKSVAFLNMGNGFICSGALANNTAQDKTPYFLTANHCYFDGGGNPSDPALYSMRFNWISPNPVCGATTNSTNGPTNFTMNGSVLRARSEASDYMLVELNNDIPAGWDVVYAGWDKTDSFPSFEVGIHHPSGDIMKVSRDDTGAAKATSSGTSLWLIGGTSFGTGNGWEIGVTEGGSSGSPLFNQNGHIIGELFAGLAACSGTGDNDDYDIYGRFAIAWEGSNQTTRLKDWLDPGNLNPNTLDEFKNVLATNDELLEQNITLFPNPTTGLIQVKIAEISGDLQYDVFNLLGQKLRSNTLKRGEAIDLSMLPNSIYLIRVTDLERNASLTKKIVLNK